MNEKTEFRIEPLLAVIAGLAADRESRDEVSLDDELQSLGIDSARLVELIMAVEREYQIVFAEECLIPATFTSVRSLSEVVQELVEN